MAVQIPVETDGSRAFAFLVELAEQDYLFNFYWSDENSAWFFDLRDGNAEPLRLGIRLILGEMLRRGGDARLPAGRLFAIDLSGDHVEAGLEDLGVRVKLYFEATDG